MQRTQRISGDDDLDSKVWTLPDILGGFPDSWQYFLLFNEFHVRIQWLGLEDEDRNEDRKQSLWIDICNMTKYLHMFPHRKHPLYSC